MPVEVLAPKLAFLLKYSTRDLLAQIETALSTGDQAFTLEQYALLALLAKQSPQPQNLLARQLARDEPSVSRMVKALVEAQLVEKHRDRRDCRVHSLSLTQAGHSKHRELQVLLHQLQETLPLSPQELHQLYLLLHRLSAPA